MKASLFETQLNKLRKKFRIKKSPEPPIKLFTIVRGDIPPGYQLAQTLHAGLDLAYSQKEKFNNWKKESNTVVCLSVKDEFSLKEAYLKAIQLGYSPVVFTEPDIENEFTSFSFIGSAEAGRKLDSVVNHDITLALIDYVK